HFSFIINPFRASALKDWECVAVCLYRVSYDCVCCVCVCVRGWMGMHRNFEGQLLCPGKKGQHVNFCHRWCRAPVTWTHILPIPLETLTNRRRHAPVPMKFCSRNTI